MYKKVFILVSFFLFSILMLQHAVFAQAQSIPALDLTLSPAFLDLSTNPGDSITQKFRIRNNSDKAMNLSITVDTLDASSTTGQIVPRKAPANDSSPSWLSFPTTTFVAPSREWQEIPVTITIPKDAAFGYYFAVRIGQTIVEPKTTTTGAKLLGQIILPILLTVRNDNAKKELSLISFKTDSYINEYMPVRFSLQLKNTGNVHLRPQGNIFITTGQSDKDTVVLTINPSAGAILPHQTRTFLSDWTDGFFVRVPVVEDGITKKDSHGNVVHTLVVNWDKITHFRIGKYSATMIAVYDNGKRDVALQAQTSFWIFPYKLIAGVILACIILFFILRFLLKLYIKKELRKYQQR